MLYFIPRVLSIFSDPLQELPHCSFCALTKLSSMPKRMVCTFRFAPPVWQTGEIGYCIRKMLCLEAFFLRQLWQTTQSPLQNWCRHSQPDLSNKMWYCIKKCYMLGLFPRSWTRCGKLRSRHCSCSGDCKLGAGSQNLFSKCLSGFTCLAGCGIASEKCILLTDMKWEKVVKLLLWKLVNAGFLPLRPECWNLSVSPKLQCFGEEKSLN